MSSIPVDNVSNGWAPVLVACAIGVFGATAISLCDKKIRKIALDSFFSIIPRPTYWKKPFPSRDEIAKNIQMRALDSKIKKQLPLISEKKERAASRTQSVLIREIAPNGDCFFLCAAIGLLEYLQQHKEYLPFISNVIQKDPALYDQEKELHVSFLTRVSHLRDKDDLESIFSDNKCMNQMVLLLRSLMGSALEEEPDYEISSDVSRAAITKKKIYEKIDVALGIDLEAESQPITLEEYRKILGCIQEDSEYITTIIDCIGSNSLVSLKDKEACIEFLMQSAFLEDAKDLESLFVNNERLICILLNSLKPEESKVKVLSKENFYAEILGALDKDSKERLNYSLDKGFTPEAFKKIVRLTRYSFAWPSDACIRALCKKLNIGFTIFKKEELGVAKRTCVENLPSAGTLLLENNHYSKLYALPPFQIARKFFGTVKEGRVEALEIKTAPKDVFFLGTAVALLDFLYKNKEAQSKFNSVLEESSECIELMNRASQSETEADLQAVFKDIPSMNLMILQLKSLVSDVAQSDVRAQAETLFAKLGFSIKIGIEERSEFGALTVDPIYSPSNDHGILLFQGQKIASFFPKK